MKTVVQPYDEEVDVTVLEVDMPEPELLEQKTGSPEVTPKDWEKVKPIYTDFMRSYTSHPEQPVEQWLGGKLQEYLPEETSVYKGYKQDKIEMRGDRAEMSDFPLYLNTVAGGLDRRDQTIGGFSFVVKIYAVPVVEIIG